MARHRATASQTDADLDLDRRFVLRALAALAPSLACGRPGVVPGVVAPQPERQRVSAAVVAIGRRYLAQVPEESTRQALHRALGITDPHESDDDRLARINAALARELAGDAAVDLVALAGWQLAPTECRVYALAALTAAPNPAQDPGQDPAQNPGQD